VGEERRKHERVSVTPADLRLSARNPFRIESILDISLGGMRLEMSGKLPKVGELVDITLHLPAGDQKVDATVRHIDHARVGVEFDDPDLIESIAGEWIREQIKKSK
jgi:hypothetical protein